MKVTINLEFDLEQTVDEFPHMTLDDLKDQIVKNLNESLPHNWNNDVCVWDKNEHRFNAFTIKKINKLSDYQFDGKSGLSSTLEMDWTENLNIRVI